MSDILNAIFARRPKNLGYNCNRFIELVQGEAVDIQFWEPDPDTFRGDYYYNARLNVLYKKVRSSDPACEPQVFYWQPLFDSSC